MGLQLSRLKATEISHAWPAACGTAPEPRCTNREAGSEAPNCTAIARRRRRENSVLWTAQRVSYLSRNPKARRSGFSMIFTKFGVRAATRHLHLAGLGTASDESSVWESTAASHRCPGATPSKPHFPASGRRKIAAFPRLEPMEWANFQPAPQSPERSPLILTHFTVQICSNSI